MNEQAYTDLQAIGASAAEVYQQMRANNVDRITAIRLLRQLFGLSLAEAKQVTIVGDGWAPSLAAYQQQIAELVVTFLE